MLTRRRRAVVITALPVERAAVLEHLNHIEREPPLHGSIYRRGIFDERSEPWEVIVAEIGAGNQVAAAEAVRVISHYQPEVALFVGVAGAIKDLRHGDVVASTKVYGYESGKAEDEVFRPRPAVQLTAYALEQQARYAAGETNWQLRIKGSAKQQPAPEAKVGPIAAGEKVVASNRSQIYEFLRNCYSDAIAVEMEGHGFLLGVHMNHPTQGIVIRGISDCIGDKNASSDEKWQPIAASHAAAFAFQILAEVPDSTDASLEPLTEARDRFPGVQKLDAYWQALSSIAEYPLLASVFTVSREAEIDVVTEWLSGPPDSLFMRSSGSMDGLDFLAALSASETHTTLQEGLIVQTIESWRELSASKTSWILIVGVGLQLQSADIADAVRAGHRVFMSSSRSAARRDQEHSLPRQDHHSIQEALVTSGYSESRATSVARACCGSSGILKRLITRLPSTEFPAWSHEDVCASVAPFALLGGWVHVDGPSDAKVPLLGSAPPMDVWAVTEFLECTRSDLDAQLARWQGGIDPLFMRLGASVFISSREDAWFLLGHAVTATFIKRFADLAILVLEEDKPAFELPRENWWAANLYGKVRSLSGEFRRSIVETLALMTCYPTAEPSTAAYDAKRVVGKVLETVLPSGARWQRWASFGSNLSLIAEADPDFFLARVEADLLSASPELPKLFQDQSHSLTTPAIHSDLLWALETLAWSPKYLLRASLCLARLAAQDPGGTYANRPSNSLHEIYLWWLWHTTASLEVRIDALKAILEAVPTAGWIVLKDVLPGGPSITSLNTRLPRWRPWADGWSRAKLQPEIPGYVVALAELSIEAAGTNCRRWANLLDRIFRVSTEITRKALKSLETLASTNGNADEEAKFTLWSELGRLLSQHEQYADAPWSYPKDLREQLLSIRNRITPDDPVRKHRWLFDQDARVPGIDILKDLPAHDRLLNDARREALREILTDSGVPGVFELIDLQADAYTVGRILGDHTLINADAIDIPSLLEDPDHRRKSFIAGFISGQFNATNGGFVSQLPISDWGEEQVAAFAAALPFTESTWHWLDSYSNAAKTEYWRRAIARLHNPNVREVRIAVDSLADVGRWWPAIEVLQFAVHGKVGVPSDYIADLLEKNVEASEDQLNGDRSGMLAYYIQQLIMHLQNDGEFDRGRLAQIEWRFLAFLGPNSGKVEPVTLLASLNSEPGFVVELLKVIYRGDNDSPRSETMSEQEQLRAHNALQLLDRLSRLPGMGEDGSVDIDRLKEWVATFQRIAGNNDRLNIGNFFLGQLIGRATISLNEEWAAGPLATLFEELASEDLARGFVNSVINSSGATWRSADAGGSLERSHVERYRMLELKAQRRSPLLARAFSQLVEFYERRAKEEDERAERRKLGRW